MRQFPDGGRLASTYVGAIITPTTRRELGAAVKPRLFRDRGVYDVGRRDGAFNG